jgi:hypothetical protein
MGWILLHLKAEIQGSVTGANNNTMGDGRWTMDYGRWAMGDGQWAMGDNSCDR